MTRKPEIKRRNTANVLEPQKLVVQSSVAHNYVANIFLVGLKWLEMYSILFASVKFSLRENIIFISYKVFFVCLHFMCVLLNLLPSICCRYLYINSHYVHAIVNANVNAN